ncbi:MAG: hypothetical protein KC464_25460, partial [Myxococcales bacterium]|nr:hypothetical protein [Myxococcales bacterium]
MTPRRVLTRHARRAVLGAALVAGGCTFQPADPPSGGPATAVRGDEIIGGGPAADDDAVVLLASFPTDRSVLATCSAVAISPTVLLTAAHCVDAGTHPGYIFGAFLGADASAYPTLVELEPHLVAI